MSKYTLDRIKVRLDSEKLDNINSFVSFRKDNADAKKEYTKAVSELERKKEKITSLKSYCVENEELYGQVVAINKEVASLKVAFNNAQKIRNEERKKIIASFFKSDNQIENLYNSYLAYIYNDGLNSSFTMKVRNGKTKDVVLSSKQSFAGLLKDFVVFNGLRRVDNDNINPLTDYFKRIIGGKVNRRDDDIFISAMSKDAFKELIISALLQFIIDTESYIVIDGELYDNITVAVLNDCADGIATK